MLQARFRFLITNLLLIISFMLAGTKSMGQDSGRNRWWRNLHPDSLTSRTLHFLPMPQLAYTPETGLQYGVAFDYFFNAGSGAKADTVRESYIWTNVYYSTRNQLIIQPIWQVYTNGEAWYSRGTAGYVNNFEKVWGFDNQNNDEKAYSRLTYERLFLQGLLARRMAKGVFAGLRVNASYMYDASEEGNSRVNTMPGAYKSGVVGLGPVFLFDHRDHPYNTMRGWYLEASAAMHTPWLGSDYRYTDWQLDGRYYHAFKPGSTLALQGTASLISGTAPWREWNRVGGPNMLRGFFEGRYRGRNLLAVQAEYRHQLTRYFKLAVFLATGQVVNHLNEFSLKEYQRIAGGAGFRLLLNQKRQLYFRTDVAFTNDGTRGLYFRLGEAF